MRTITSDFQLVIEGEMHKFNTMDIHSFELGDLKMRSKVFPDAAGVIKHSCEGQFTQSVFFGKAGVGKSTVASLVSSKPGLFASGSASSGTTTFGTWLSTSIVDGPYSAFVDTQLQNVAKMPIGIPELESLT